MLKSEKKSTWQYSYSSISNGQTITKKTRHKAGSIFTADGYLTDNKTVIKQFGQSSFHSFRVTIHHMKGKCFTIKPTQPSL